MRRLFVACLVAIVASGYSLVMGAANTAKSDLPDPKTVANQILASPAGHFMTSNARMMLEMTARGDLQLSQGSDSQSPTASARAAAGTKPAQGGDGPGNASLANVRVNNPAEDTHQIGQTTQSETAITAVGNNVAVGFNDSQHSLTTLTAGTNINGVSYSQDGGASFTDGGVIPNHPGCNNAGDPWLTSDRSGAMYYASLAMCQPVGKGITFDIGVSKSTDGGKAWSQPVILTASISGPFYMGDKDAMTAGRDPSSPSKDVLYVAWDDFTFDPFQGPINGLPVAHSNDGGATWSIVYLDQVPLGAPCPNSPFGSFAQYIGAVPIVGANGSVYVAAEKISQACPDAGAGVPPPLVRSIQVFKSINGGVSFGPSTQVGEITPAAPPFDAFNLGQGKIMRNLEFPTAAFLGNNLYIAWNDGGATGAAAGHSHIRLAKSSDGGATWTDGFVTGGSNDQMQPAMSGDQSGLHILYYQRNPDNTLDVKVSNSEDGQAFSAMRVTTRSFPGVLTTPNFDPIVSPAYMGDYIANISAGGGQLFAWGDNRDMVRDFLFPDGRNDPNVYFAARQGEGGGQNGGQNGG